MFVYSQSMSFAESPNVKYVWSIHQNLKSKRMLVFSLGNVRKFTKS